MDGIIIIDKPKGFTSRDIVNILCKEFDTKKIGHTGTLDPIATGVLVICVGKATKLVEMLTCDDKDYIANVKLGILTDTLDLDGKVIKEEKVVMNNKKLLNVISSYKKSYEQEVPIYSAVKVNGKKLYEYARSGIEVDRPKRIVNIKDIKLLDCKENDYSFFVNVSKGTYIRSLIYDINNDLNVIGVMSDLRRVRQGTFDIKDACTIDDIKKGNYSLISINQLLKNKDCVTIDDTLYQKVKNGSILDNIFNKKFITFVYNGNVVAIYKTYKKDTSKIKPYRMFV